jgi:uncharacterized protein (DUF362 family)
MARAADHSIVVIHDSGLTEYPLHPPFHPDAHLPEYPFGSQDIQGDNWVYDAVREVLRERGLDSHNFGTRAWNPLGEYIKPGDRVVVKPNLVISEHELGLEGLLASVAHGSIIRALVDYVFIACGSTGRITICDSPIKEVDFEKITGLIGLRGVMDFYGALDESQRPPVELLDIRDLVAHRDQNGTIVDWKALRGDPRGYTIVDLGRDSMLSELGSNCSRLRSTAAVYENEANKRHAISKNEYSFPNTILEAHVIFSLAKLKVHRKAGVTLSLKNMVGTTNEKRWLPHHRAGTPSQGGDMTPDAAPPDRKLQEFLADVSSSHRYGYVFRRRVLPFAWWVWRQLHLKALLRRGRRYIGSDWREGDWHGNDTIWRTVLDLNMALRYADSSGQMRPQPQRRIVCFIDGIIGGDREGPLHPRPRPAGLLVMGDDAVAVDTVCTAVMGFDPLLIPTLVNASRTRYPIGNNDISAVTVVSNESAWRDWREIGWRHLAFEASEGWRRHLELTPESAFYVRDLLNAPVA